MFWTAQHAIHHLRTWVTANYAKLRLKINFAAGRAGFWSFLAALDNRFLNFTMHRL
jgi:hypothetical protein